MRLKGLWALTHPGPSLVTALAYAVFALLAAHGRPDLITLTATLFGMIAVQFAISAFNDYCDREADKRSHKFKPVALGILPPWAALAMTAFFTALMIACYAPYGLTPLLIAGAFLVLGFAYDLGLKSTPLGAVMMGLAFPLLPLLAWDLFAAVTPALFWTFPLGLAIGASIHIADALPDVAADRAAGAHGLTQALGRYAFGVEWLLLAGASLLVVLLAAIGATSSRPIVLLITTPLSFVLLLAAIATHQRREWPVQQRLRVNFLLTVLAALVVAVGWVVSALV
ncbi:MAG TPA: UbiA family prenyltransferase [Ktedonobacterales bacterium]|nr:UbiA family prenyltransferase [Ktedonobacterales bacterium]